MSYHLGNPEVFSRSELGTRGKTRYFFFCSYLVFHRGEWYCSSTDMSELLLKVFMDMVSEQTAFIICFLG